jgi:glycerol kinase
MSDRDLILALDQGTTSSRALVVDRRGTIVASAQEEFPQGFPSPGHVTHDPEDIWRSQLAVARTAVERTPGGIARVAAIGIANQRETTVVWERATGRPVGPAIVWQSRITAPACEALRAAGHEERIRSLTGLPVDAYFSGTKVAHILDATPGLRARAEDGELCFGTIDSFLLWRLSGGRVHATDVSNASRTLLFDITRLAWDPWLCEILGAPMAMLPQVRPSSGVVVETEPELLGAAVPVAGIAGDQQAATFGQACLEPGSAKNTYGTGAFALLHIGAVPSMSTHGLLTTILWQLGDGAEATVAYALEGSVFVAGSAVQWLRDGLGIIGSSSDVEALAASAAHDSGVVVVPAFVGLGAPHWDPHARGAILGLTRGTTAADIARATVDSMAHQVADVLDAMAADAGAPLSTLRVDGGAARNDGLLQLQADLLGVPVERPRNVETTASGVAFLAGLAVGLWSGLDEIGATWELDRRFEPRMDPAERTRLAARWRDAVERTKGWATAT